jgi:hypothetical protein
MTVSQTRGSTVRTEWAYRTAAGLLVAVDDETAAHEAVKTAAVAGMAVTPLRRKVWTGPWVPVEAHSATLTAEQSVSGHSDDATPESASEAPASRTRSGLPSIDRLTPQMRAAISSAADVTDHHGGVA